MSEETSAPVPGRLIQGDDARYGYGPGLWRPVWPGAADYARLISRMQASAAHARAAQRAAVACGLGGSELESALHAQAEEAEALLDGLRLQVYVAPPGAPGAPATTDLAARAQAVSDARAQVMAADLARLDAQQAAHGLG